MVWQSQYNPCTMYFIFIIYIGRLEIHFTLVNVLHAILFAILLTSPNRILNIVLLNKLLISSHQWCYGMIKFFACLI